MVTPLRPPPQPPVRPWSTQRPYFFPPISGPHWNPRPKPPSDISSHRIHHLETQFCRSFPERRSRRIQTISMQNETKLVVFYIYIIIFPYNPFSIVKLKFRTKIKLNIDPCQYTIKRKLKYVNDN